VGVMVHMRSAALPPPATVASASIVSPFAVFAKSRCARNEKLFPRSGGLGSSGGFVIVTVCTGQEFGDGVTLPAGILPGRTVSAASSPSLYSISIVSSSSQQLFMVTSVRRGPSNGFGLRSTALTHGEVGLVPLSPQR